jgi:hypothetical protein
MTEEQTTEFNLHNVGVLAKQPDGSVSIESVPLDEQSDAESFLAKLKTDLEAAQSASVTQILSQITSSTQLAPLLQPYSICKSFSRAYVDHNYTLGQHPRPGFGEDPALGDPEALLQELRVRLLAYQLQCAYSRCEAYIKEKRQALYTHRKRGFQLPKYQVNDDVAVDLKTNFGYGSSSYFYLRLTYRDLPIRPYSEWVEYQHAKRFEVVEFWRNYKVDNESWFGALIDCRDAANLALRDPHAFLEKYVVEELTSLVAGLNAQLTEAEAYVENHAKRIFVDECGRIAEDGITLRGAKIVGALNFIRAINEFQNHVDVSPFVDRICACNKTFRETMLRENLLIASELERLGKEIADIDSVLSSLHQQFPVHVGVVKCFTPCLREWTEKLNQEVATFLPKFEMVVQKYVEMKSQKSKKEELDEFLRRLQSSVQQFTEEVEKYFRVPGEEAG